MRVAHPLAVSVDGPAMRAICGRFGVRRLDVFGSSVTEHFDPARSDVDVLVEFKDESYVGFADRYFGLHEALTELFERPVDLVTDRSVTNPYRRRSIWAERRQVFPAS